MVLSNGAKKLEGNVFPCELIKMIHSVAQRSSWAGRPGSRRFWRRARSGSCSLHRDFLIKMSTWWNAKSEDLFYHFLSAQHSTQPSQAPWIDWKPHGFKDRCNGMVAGFAPWCSGFWFKIWFQIGILWWSNCEIKMGPWIRPCRCLITLLFGVNSTDFQAVPAALCSCSLCYWRSPLCASKKS